MKLVISRIQKNWIFVEYLRYWLKFCTMRKGTGYCLTKRVSRLTLFALRAKQTRVPSLNESQPYLFLISSTNTFKSQSKCPKDYALHALNTIIISKSCIILIIIRNIHTFYGSLSKDLFPPLPLIPLLLRLRLRHTNSALHNILPLPLQPLRTRNVKRKIPILLRQINIRRL